MFAVLMLFLLPVGGGIPAGVLLARTKGLGWPLTTGLYFISDVILALAFEPVLRLFVAWGRRVPWLARLILAMKESTARSVSHFGGTGAGPFTLILIAFGVDPMTGRATALGAGHGFVTGWALAITGDMLYFGVIALTTLGLNRYLHNPNVTVLVVLGAMIVVPSLIRRGRAALGFRQRPA